MSCASCGRRAALARKYLAVEGHRALAANEDLLPHPVRSLIDLDLATRTHSAAESLTVAESGEVADPPASFGVIKPRKSPCRACERRARRRRRDAHVPAQVVEGAWPNSTTTPTTPTATTRGSVLQPGRRRRCDRETAAGMLSRVRQLNGSGPPGADTPTHRSHNGIRGAGMVTSTAASAVGDRRRRRRRG